MSEALLVQIAEAVTVEIGKADFGLAFTPERSWADWDEELEDADTLHVDVVGVSAKARLETRAELLYTVRVDVGVRKRFGADGQDSATGRVSKWEVDQLVRLTQRIGEYFSPVGAMAGRLEDVPAAAWAPEIPGESKESSGSDFRAMFIREHLRVMRQFTGLVRFAYEAPHTPDG